MAEETEQADSTALLEPMQEIAEDEPNVVTETLASAEKKGSDNMSLSELTNQLLASDEEQNAEETETTEEAVVEEDTVQQEDSKIEQPGLVASTDESETDKKLILDNYGIDLDNLSEDEAKSLGRALRTESMKRFGRLTAQKREAEAKIADLESKTTSESQAAPVGSKEDPMSEVWTLETLQKKETDLQAIEDWAEESLQSEEKYDDNGEEYLVEVDGKRYTKQDLQSIRSNTRKMLRKGGALDKRHQFLADRQHFDGQALQFFPWMSDESSSEFGEYQQFVGQDKYKAILDSIPESNLFAGLLVEGNLRVRERMKANESNGSSASKPKEKPTAPATAASAAPPRMSASENTRHRQAIAQAQKSFEETGSFTSLARLRELQGQSS